MNSITLLLAQAHDGRSDAWDRIYELLYRELHQIARAQLRRHHRHNQSPTSLISAGWLKLAGAAVNAENRMHLVALMAKAMRYAILDETKRVLASKRGGGVQHLALDQVDTADQSISGEDLLHLDEALRHLSEIDQRLAIIVELRYFGGLSDREIGDLLGQNERTVRREWYNARSFLISKLGG